MKTIAWMMVVIMGLLGCLPSVQAANPASVAVAVTADEAAVLETVQQEAVLSLRAGSEEGAMMAQVLLAIVTTLLVIYAYDYVINN